MENKKRNIMVGVAVFLVVFMTMTIGKGAFKTVSENKETDSIGSSVEQEVETEKEIEIEKEDKEDNFNYSDEIAVPVGKKSELTEVTAINFEEQIRRASREFKFSEAGDLIYNMREDYNIRESKYSDVFEQLFHDNAVMQNLQYMDDEMLKANIAKTIKDPESQLIATLFLNSITREYLIRHEDSLNPEFKGGISVKEKNIVEADSDLYKEAKHRNKNMEILYEIKIELEENSLLAYVGKENESSFVYKILPESGAETDYLTVTEWRELRDTIGIN